MEAAATGAVRKAGFYLFSHVSGRYFCSMCFRRLPASSVYSHWTLGRSA